MLCHSNELEFTILEKIDMSEQFLEGKKFITLFLAMDQNI